MFELRDYQENAVKAVLADWSEGYSDVLITMATGLGKTAVFLASLDKVLWGNGKRGLIIAHRKELIEQPVARLYDYFPQWEGLAGVVMAEIDQPDRKITVATIQTLNVERRLQAILSHGKIDYLVVDEAHHAVAKSYRNVYARLREANPDLKHLGVTATPIRGDGDGLISVYQRESFKQGIKEGINSGYLAPVRWLGIQVNISLANVASRAGDFVQKQLANVFDVDECFDLVVKSHKEYAHNRQAACFTTSVDGAYRLAEAFKNEGYRAEAADGTTNKKERGRILDRFARGKTQILCNVALYTEGLDVPEISCIHQVRPTQSDGLYTQIIGRALRTFPGKKDALILDYAPKSQRNITMAGDVLGVPLRKDSYVDEDTEAGEVMGGFTFDGEFTYSSNGAEIVAKQLDYLDLSPWSWYRGDNGWMTLGLGEASDKLERVLVISPPTDGEMQLHGLARTIKENNDGRKKRGPWRSYNLKSGIFDRLQTEADRIADEKGNAILASKQRNWRKDPATDAQIKFARRLGCYKPGMSKGLLAQAITHSQALRFMGV